MTTYPTLSLEAFRDTVMEGVLEGFKYRYRVQLYEMARQFKISVICHLSLILSFVRCLQVDFNYSGRAPRFWVFAW